LAGFNLVKVPISQVQVTRWRYQLKVGGVKLPREIHIPPNQGFEPRSFQVSECIGVGYECRRVDFLVCHGIFSL
jgi:hypothetical protein